MTMPLFVSPSSVRDSAFSTTALQLDVEVSPANISYQAEQSCQEFYVLNYPSPPPPPFLVNTGNQFPPIAAQDLPFVLKAGYLEKRRKDHSFLGFEWQKRWCALSKTVFYYYGSDKDKQQKGEFAIEGYDVRMNNTLRKDGKKDCCFEICAPDKRIYQFTAASPKDAEEWVQQLKFILQDMGSDVIPEDDDERGELYDDVDHPVPVSNPSRNQPIDDEIYEELP
ncbi:hypothetical protein STEG23_012204, partial [Scotinomys teguina]